MDKKIKKVGKDLEQAKKAIHRGEKDEKSLLKLDKAHDKKMEKCDMKMKKKK